MGVEYEKCSNKNHSKINAIIYCQDCRLYMCNTCSNLHSDLFGTLHTNILKNLKKGLSTGYCTKENHNREFEFYCKTHNQLVCDACLCKINTKGKGQHNKCD